MSDRTITFAMEHGKGRYVLRDGGHEAELTYSPVSDAKVIADHTGVPDGLRGKDAGLDLVTQLVADARTKGFQIVPLCPFVEEMRRRHPEWADVFTT